MLLENGLIPATDVAYEIDNSLRFNDDDSAYLSRTPASAGNRKTWTWSGWFKRGNIGIANQQCIYHSYDGVGGQRGEVYFDTNDTLVFWQGAASGDSNGQITTKGVFRDPSAWYHIVIQADFGNTTGKIYVNGVEQDVTVNASFQNRDGMVNGTHQWEVGGRTSNRFVDGYLAEVNFIDGQALTPDNFGETGDYGEWKPIKYAGTYGTNGFYLDFENSGSLGADTSGNGNNWTPTNLTANDQMLDSPTNNFCTLDPLQKVDSDSSIQFSQGNLSINNTNASLWAGTYSSFGVSSGKWYWEAVTIEGDSTADMNVGIQQFDGSTPVNWDAVSPQNYSGSIYYYGHDGGKRISGAKTAYGSSYGIGDIVGVALDMDAETITFYKNNVSQGSLNLSSTSNDGTTVTPAFAHYIPAITANFGQDSSFAGNKTAQGNSDDNGIGDFYYTPPTGYLALCTQNLPDATVIPSEHFNTVTWAAVSPYADISVTGVGFQPDLVWAKHRTQGYEPTLFDSVRGVGKALMTSTTSTEVTNNIYGYLGSFDSDGFTGVDGGTDNSYFNYNAASAYVAWNWKMAGTGVSNTDGTITSTVSANTAAGQSIVSYTGTNTSSESVGHGLSKAPELIIAKNRNEGGASDGWPVQHHQLESGGTPSRLILNSTTAQATYSDYWTTSFPTSTVFYVGSNDQVNETGDGHIAYCFHSVEGYSKVGSYTGNGSTDGTFVYTGFRPAFIMLKVSSIANRWVILDNERPTYNPPTTEINPNSSSAEFGTTANLDMLSNGFKLRRTGDVFNNNHTYIYIAFAEHPFKYTNAR